MCISARLVPEVQSLSMAAPAGAPLVRRLRIEHDDLGFLEETARLLGFRSRMLQLEAGTNPSRLELAADTATPEMSRKLDDVKWAMLDEWAQTKRAPKHAAWMHEQELAT